jgi:hypothetical protein
MAKRATIETERAALASIAGRIAELEQQRSEKLLSDVIDEVQGIDRELEAEKCSAAVHRDRIAALEEIKRTEDRRRREREKAAGIEIVKKRLAHRRQLAIAVEAAIKDMAAKYFELVASAGDIFADWPEGLPPPNRSTDLTAGTIKKEFGYALYAAGRPNAMTGCQLPAPAMSSAVAGLGVRGLAASVEEAGELFLVRLKSSPTAEAEDDDEVAA